MSSGDEAKIAAVGELEESDLLDYGSRLVLRAISQSGPYSISAFKAWRAIGTLDDADFKHHRAMALLAEVAARAGIADPDIARMRGVGRHLWTNNNLKLSLLFKALDTLNARGVVPLLLTSAALYAQAPDMIRHHPLGDIEILVHTDQFKDAIAVLAAEGFTSDTLILVTIGETLVESPPTGIRMRLNGHLGEIVIRCHALDNVGCVSLTKALWQDSVPKALRGRAVRVPSQTHHLFLTAARCEPWNAVECFDRLLEGSLLLSLFKAEVDWDRLALCTTSYKLEECMRSYLAALVRDTAHHIPNSIFALTTRTRTASGREEWRILKLRPRQRTRRQWRLLMAQGLLPNRCPPAVAPISAFEALLRLLWPSLASVRPLWRMACRRLHLDQVEAPRYVDELPSLAARIRRRGRLWKMITVPLTPSQKAGEPLLLRVEPLMSGTDIHVAISGGNKSEGHVISNAAPLEINIVVRPLSKLGGDGVLLLRLMEGAISQEGNY